MIQQENKNRPIRSFVRRLGRMTLSQKNALTQLWERYGLELTDDHLNYEKIFGRQGPVILEIGFGMGEALIEMASKDPNTDFIGVEVHLPGVGTLLKRVEILELKNIRVFSEDAIEVLKTQIPIESLAGVHLFFPDPWPKKRHHKRRLVQSDFIKLVETKLKPGGYIHMATDWEDYAQHMLKIMSAEEKFVNKAGLNVYYDRPENRPQTKFEQRGKKLGHPIWDLYFIKKLRFPQV